MPRLVAFALLMLAAALAGCAFGDQGRAGWSVYQGSGHCEGPSACDLIAKSGRGRFNLSVQGEGPARDFFGFYSSDVAPGTYVLEWSGPMAERVEVRLYGGAETPCRELSLDGAQVVAEPDHCRVLFHVDDPLRAGGSTTLGWRLDHEAWNGSPRGVPVPIQFTATRIA